MTLPTHADVVIVGGGVMGASAAFHLSEADVDVVLLERGELSGGSTSKAAGGVRANFSDELNIMLGKRSLDLFEDFGNRPGQEIDLHRSGYLFVLTRPEDVELFTASVALQNSLGVPSRMVDVDEACRLSPLLNPEGILAAAWSPEDGHCTPESVVLGYATGARRLGATVRTGVEVTGIATSQGAITQVSTTDGEISTGCVIDCAGAWSPEVASYVGVDLPVTP
ncbi:MAG: FAD-binding oxidoreductase, partial [Candidatus Nanopelagicales bacterium]